MPSLPRPSRRAVQVLVALLLLLAGGLAVGIHRFSPDRGSPKAGAEGAAAAPGSAAPAGARGNGIAQTLELVAAGADETPRDRWDPGYVAGLIGSDPQDLLRWVRERSVWIPYRGVLRGPVGVMMDGQGNSLDRALVLAALLQRAGHTVRLAHAELGADAASRLLPALVARRRAVAAGPRESAPPDAWRDEVVQLTQAYDLDAKGVMDAVAARLQEVGTMYRTLDQRAEDQTRRLGAALGGGRPAADPERVRTALADLRDHWWVQYQARGTWTDLDLLGGVRGAPVTTATETVAPEALDSALYHRVVVRLVTERLAGGRLSTKSALQGILRPMDVLGRPVALQIMPESWQPGMIAVARDPAAAFRTAALEQEEWHATLAVDKEAVAEAVLSRSGKTQEPAGGGPFGGLGAGIARAGGAAKGSGELTAAWIEYEVQRPGAPAAVERRQVFDLVGPGARAAGGTGTLEMTEARRLERSLALFRSTDILPLGGGIAPEYVAHLAAASLLGNADLLRGPAPAVSTGTEMLDLLNQRAIPPLSPLYALAAVRLAADPGAEVFLDRPNVLTRHEYLAQGPQGIVRLTATDIVANQVGVALDQRNPVEQRRRQGVRDTNAEALVYGAATPGSSVAAAYAGGGKWVTITAADDHYVERLPADLRQRMRDDLAAGYTIVAPADAARAASAELTGWWRIDPRTGHTLGVSGSGWGQSAVEKAAIIMGAVAVGWTWAYLLCSGALYVPGKGNSTTAAAPPLPLDWLAPPLSATATADKDPCIFDAWVEGITSGVFQSMTIMWPFFTGKYGWLKFFERPLFATGGGGGPGELPPIFGGKGAAPPAPEPCPPGGGGGVAQGEGPGAPKGTGAPPEAGPPPEGPMQEGPPKPPGEAPAGEEPSAPRGTAGEEPAPSAGRTATRPFDEQWGDMEPLTPKEMSEQVNSANAAAAEAKPKLPAAQAEYDEARAATQAAKQEYEAAQADASSEAMARRGAAGEAYANALARERAAANELAGLQKAVAIGERQQALQPLNDALYQARADMRVASERYAQAIRDGRADFNGGEGYAEYQMANERYQRALKEFAAANRPGGTAPTSGSGGGGAAGGTEVMPERPLPGPGNTQPLPQAGTGPGQTQPQPGTGPGQTQPLPGPSSSPPAGGNGGNGEAYAPTQAACANSPPPGSPPPGSPKGAPPKAAGGKNPGKAPNGEGPFQGDPDNRKWLRENWSPDPRKANESAGAMGDPAIYDNADQVAAARYNEARGQGMDDQAARQESWESWWQSVQSARQAQGIRRNPTAPGVEWVGPVPAHMEGRP